MMKRIAIFALAAAALAACGNMRQAEKQPHLPVVPKRYGYEVVATYPHLTSSYTQGLQYIDGEMWEGTGEYGNSRLQRIDLATGRAEVAASLPRSEFGEGITVLGDSIYYLTWRNRKAHLYERTSGRRLRDFAYEGEGWGLTSDGERLYMSDGTSIIRILDPATFKQYGSISVICNGTSLPYLNELEWIDGRIWANVYTSDFIAIIDPATGIVEGLADMSGLLAPDEITATTDVLNGIAWDSAGNRIFVTGKNWPKLFEIKLIEQ